MWLKWWVDLIQAPGVVVCSDVKISLLSSKTFSWRLKRSKIAHLSQKPAASTGTGERRRQLSTMIDYAKRQCPASTSTDSVKISAKLSQQSTSAESSKRQSFSGGKTNQTNLSPRSAKASTSDNSISITSPPSTRCGKITTCIRNAWKKSKGTEKMLNERNSASKSNQKVDLRNKSRRNRRAIYWRRRARTIWTQSKFKRSGTSLIDSKHFRMPCLARK